MTDVLHAMRTAFTAALKDTAQNILRPIHNLKVAIGLAKEERISEKLEKAARERTRNIPSGTRASAP